MTEQQIGAYYHNLHNGEKGRFTAYLSLNLGGSPHSWQQKMLLWSSNTAYRPAIFDADNTVLLVVVLEYCMFEDFSNANRVLLLTS